MKLLKKSLSIIILFMLFVLSGSILTTASELNFSVEPLIPEDIQVDKNKTFYDVKIDKGQKKTLEAKLRNSTKKDVTVDVTLNRATTNVNGNAEYVLAPKKKDPSLKYDIVDIITVKEPEVTIKPGEEKIIQFEVNMPAEDYEGVLAGGINFKEKNAKDDKEEEDTGMAIKNEYAYLVAVVLHGNVPQDDIASEVKLNKVKADQLNYRNVIAANLQNPKAKYINNMAIKATVTKENQTEALYSLNKESLQMAPNSNFNYSVPLLGNKLKAGNYTLTMSVKSDSGEWDFKENFKISADEAKKLNEKDVSIEKEDNRLLYIIIGAVALVLILLIILIIYLIRKNKKQKARSKKKRSSSSGKGKNKKKTNKKSNKKSSKR